MTIDSFLSRRYPTLYIQIRPFQVALVVMNPPAMQETEETQVQSLGQVDPLEEAMAIHSTILTWRIPWTEEPGGLQSIASQRVRYD